MAHAGLIVGAFARAELRPGSRLLLAFWRFDQLPEPDGFKIDLDIQITKVRIDSATAEVGPRSGVVVIEGDCAHGFAPWSGRGVMMTGV